MTPSDFLRSFWWRSLAALRVPGTRFEVQDEWATMRAIKERRASLARYGDGELMIMLGYGIYFQEYDPELARRLRKIVRNPGERFLVGLPRFGAMAITKPAWRKRWDRYQRLFSYLVRPGAEYHSTAISRPATVGNRKPEEFYRTLASLWTERDVVVVHHDAATANHPMFDSARTVRHLPCLPEHAFREYAALLDRASAFLSADVLFLIAAGPTACVLAWDLAQRGAQALDVGHLTSAYDEFTQKS